MDSVVSMSFELIERVPGLNHVPSRYYSCVRQIELSNMNIDRRP